MSYQYDKIVQTLYLAKSNKREEMLLNLVENLLFSYSCDFSFKDFKDQIRDEIGFTPYDIELRTCLDNAVSLKKLVFRNDKYGISEENQNKVALSLAEEKNIENERFRHFKENLNHLLHIAITEKDKKILWETYNEYLIRGFSLFSSYNRPHVWLMNRHYPMINSVCIFVIHLLLLPIQFAYYQ